jgi:hypothetical protein
VHNLHAVPGALGGLASVVVALAIPASAYGGDIGAMVSYDTFFVRAYLKSISTIGFESIIDAVLLLPCSTRVWRSTGDPWGHRRPSSWRL